MTLMLPAPLRNLAAILRLEAQQGYRNAAVTRGLDALLDNGRRTAADGDVLPPEPPRPYAELTADERRQWAGETLAWLGDGPPPIPSPFPQRGQGSSRKGTAATSPSHSPFPDPMPPSPPPGKGAGGTGRRPALTPASPVSAVPGVGAATAERLARMGIETAGQLMFLYPRRHLDYTRRVPVSRLQPDIFQTVIGVLWEASERAIGKRKGTEAVIGDETGNVRAVWFNQPYVARVLGSRVQSRIALSGKVTIFRNRPVFESPDYELLDADDEEAIHTGRLVPVYPRTEGLTAKTLRRAVKAALDACAAALDDPLPEMMRARRKLLPLDRALRAYHYPQNEGELETARRRLAFDELLVVQLGVVQRKRERQAEAGRTIAVDRSALDGFLATLPFWLTRAQQAALDDILKDIGRAEPMNRLVQGDVGSGKTVVAAAALLQAVGAGMQGALMAPTELLAEQHFRSLTRLLEAASPPRVDGYLPPFLAGRERPVQIALLTGSRSAREKAELRERIAGGQIDLVAGTHALIQESVGFANLGLVVIDEQHRFGVAQRWSLRQKGYNPHVLVMTATPIPRTLALSLYGDLDVSTIAELPPGRQPIVTKLVNPAGRASAYKFVERQLAEGRQAFVVCPLIDESPALEARAATVEYERLARAVFPQRRLGLLHGRMPPAEKDEVMRRFLRHELDLLVSTSVVEVGIDVPNASVMLIEGADRFGLSQLHQFRGRVGRGQHPSYCLLATDEPSLEAQERLQIMVDTQDGFKLAEEDLRLRGPGEFFGTRQTGLPSLQLARLSDSALWEAARHEAELLLAEDPELAQPLHATLRKRFEQAWQPGAGDVS